MGLSIFRSRKSSKSPTKVSTKIDRRQLLASAAGGLTLGFFCPEIPGVGTVEAASGAAQVNSWLNIGSDGTVTFTIGSADMGQGSFQGLAQILAEDLMVDYNTVQTVVGKPAIGAPVLGNSIGTFGSIVTRTYYWPLRQAAAAAREMLVQAAMNVVGDQNRANYTIKSGVINYQPPGHVIPYSQVAAAAAALAPPPNPPLVPDSQFQFIGKTLPRPDIPSKVTGAAIYGADIRLPGMLFCAIKHCPTLGGTLAAKPAVPAGAIAVVPTQVIAGTDRGTETVGMVNAVAVVANNSSDAIKGANGLTASWTLPANASSLNDANFISEGMNLTGPNVPAYSLLGANPPGTLYTVEGNAAVTNAAIAGAAKVVDTIFTLPYVPHVCLEPLTCTVNYFPGSHCDVYAPTQVASSVQSIVSTLTGLGPAQINVVSTYLGGGLGRKIEVDFVSQAVQVAMQIGTPVQLIWPREQDFMRDQFRPLAVIHARAGLDNSGNVVGWAYRNVSPSILAQRGSVLPSTGDNQAYEGSNGLPYNFANRVTEYVTHPSPVPVGFWRSVGGSLNTFGVESMIDSLAVAVQQDPYQFRRRLLTDPRWIGVLDAVAASCNWAAGPAAGHFRGIAINGYGNSYVAQVMEISNVSNAGLTVNAVWIAMDCYLTVNPGQVEAQLTGGLIHGLNAALYGKQSFSNGVPQISSFFPTYRMLRLSEAPQVTVTLIPSPAASDPTAPIGGAGEMAVPTTAPALANAYFKATGTRVTSLPLYPNATMSPTAY